MAGKTRKQGGRPSTPKAKVEMPKGHLGLKSSPFAPTDCKLTSQFMVVDHMNAHYRNVNSAKCAIDNGPPKAWLVSQKVRDQARRAALKSDMTRRDKWVSQTRNTSRPVSQASSDVARDEMLAMMESLDDYDEVDNLNLLRKSRAQEQSNTTMEVHVSDGGPEDPDMALIDKIVADHQNSPSKYHSTRTIASNIPPSKPTPRGSARTRQSPRPNSGRQQHYAGENSFGATTTLRNPSTPRSADLLETQAHKFTEEKPFQPRINRTNRQSKLSQFKYYNAPKNKTQTRGGGQQSLAKDTRVLHQGNNPQMRSTTPLTESVDLMNASLMSRDMHQVRTPTGVPPLDISLDKDHMHWLKEQSMKAQLRSTYQPDGQVDGGGGGGLQAGGTLRGSRRIINQPNVTGRISSGDVAEEARSDVSQRRDGPIRYPNSPTLCKVEHQEEELKYLEFITEVTNDVLDRGIFTNRVLKQVFHSHIQRRKHDLKVSRMRELLDELRQDLGLPSADDDVEPGVGLSSTLTRSTDEPHSKTLKFADPPSGYFNESSLNEDMHDLSVNDSIYSKKADKSGLNGTIGGSFDPLMMTTKKFDMATLRQASLSANQPRSRSPSPGTGRPPIPRRQSAGRLRSTPSRESSLEEDDNVFLGKSNTSLEDMEDSKISSKQEEDFSAYKQPPPVSATSGTTTHFSLPREIEPIQEQSETARTDATSVVNYEDDYEEDNQDQQEDDYREEEEEDDQETARSSASPPPKPTPRRRKSTTASSGTGSPRSTVQSTARSVDTHRTGRDTYRSEANTARTESVDTVRSDTVDTVRTEEGLDRIKSPGEEDDDF